jgi:hypothetical protein
VSHRADLVELRAGVPAKLEAGALAGLPRELQLAVEDGVEAGLLAELVDQLRDAGFSVVVAPAL